MGDLAQGRSAAPRLDAARAHLDKLTDLVESLPGAPSRPAPAPTTRPADNS